MQIVSNASPLISLKLIGDLKGRRLADNFGITYIGTLGILEVAKNKGLIREVIPECTHTMLGKANEWANPFRLVMGWLGNETWHS